MCAKVESGNMEIPLPEKELIDLKSWFTKYVKSFQHADSEIQQNITLKEEHTHRVCEAIVDIGVALGLDHNALRLAEAIALLHDIGRFEQYTRYRTFMDAKSENHAELGVKIIEREDILASFNPAAQYIIKQSVSYHNRPSLPLNESPSCLFYAKLIRDADKLDIWKVVTDYYHRRDKGKNGAIELELPNSPGFSDEVIRSLTNMRAVNINDVKNVNDFKLLQVSWVFDLNFRPTMDFLMERRYLELIRQVLPGSEQIDGVFKVIYEYENGFCS
ncbi:MAG: HD domain-containing protein [Bacteroidales bacterium]|nr:HD domain-containing protein [Bacteroidales bacterium]